MQEVKQETGGKRRKRRGRPGRPAGYRKPGEKLDRQIQIRVTPSMEQWIKSQRLHPKETDSQLLRRLLEKLRGGGG